DRPGAQVFDRHRGAVRAETEIGGVAERQDAGEAEQEVERHCRQPHDDDAAGELGIAADRSHPERHEQESQTDSHIEAAAAQAAERSFPSRQCSLPSSPSSPRGRTSSTSPIITYITASVAEGKKTAASPEATPIMRPPISVPSRLPRPP